MSDENEKTGTGNGTGNGSDQKTRQRVVTDLKAASEIIENSAFDLAGATNPDTSFVLPLICRCSSGNCLSAAVTELSQEGGG